MFVFRELRDLVDFQDSEAHQEKVIQDRRWCYMLGIPFKGV